MFDKDCRALHNSGVDRPQRKTYTFLEMYWCVDDTKPKALSRWFIALSKDCTPQHALLPQDQALCINESI